MAKRTGKTGVTLRSAKRIRISRSKGGARRTVSATGAKNITTDLNIVLKPDEINSIVRGLVGAKGKDAAKIFGPGGTVAINGGSCCVDASVGSSAIGPFSTVGSSVSHTGDVARPGGRAGLAKLKETVNRANVTVTLPRNMKIR